MAIQLLDGSYTNDRRLDRVKRVDIRSLSYPISTELPREAYYKPRGYTWRVGAHLNQFGEGACVGFDFSHEINARPKVHTVDNEFARQYYFDCQRDDPWEGGAYPGASPFYEGTSVLAGARVGQRRGYWDEYRWALSIDDVIATIGYFGPVCFGFDWYSGMMSTDDQGFIRPTGSWEGGHAILGFKSRLLRHRDGTVDYNRSWCGLWNSWGENWGLGGMCKLTYTDMMTLWPNADACIPVKRRKVAA